MWLLSILLLSFQPSSGSAASWFAASSSASTKDEDQGSSESLPGQQLVSPLLNRELKASVKASWPSSPHNLLCEAYAYLSSDENAERGPTFLDNLATLVLENEDDINWTYESAWQAVVRATPFLSQTEQALLRWSLAMRAASPTCELHRSMAVSERAKGDHRRRPASPSSSAFVVLYPPGALVEHHDSVERAMMVVVASNDDEAAVGDDASVLLPDEPVLPIDGAASKEASEERRTLAILYANLGTQSFANKYRELLQLREVRFVVRHLGNSLPANDTASSSSPGTVLQGYGVSLDIRNVEYKVFDDRSDKSGENDAEFVNASDPTLRAPPGFLAGVNLTKLESALSASERQALQSALWQAHDAQQLHTQIVPPVWQRRLLPLQATAAIAESRDPLVTLQEVSQNLPSLASTLVHVKVPDGLANRTHGLRPHAGRVYVNGVPVHMGLSTFNAFEFLNLLRDEHNKVTNLQKKLGPYLDPPQLVAVQQAWSRGSRFLKDATPAAAAAADDSDEPKEDNNDDEEDEDDDTSNDQEVVYRVDVGHGWKNAVMYLNDVEKDVQYSRWPTRLDQMLMMMQFGRPPSVRRNLFTFLSVLDPVEQPGDAGLVLSFQVMGAQYPARTGVLIISDAEVQQCAQWVAANPTLEEGEACPAEPVIKNKRATLEDLKSIKATAHAVHTLLAHVAGTYGNKGDGVMQAYAEYLFEHISNEKESNNGKLSMRDLVTIHGTLMQGMNVLSEKEGEAEAFAALLEGSDDDDDSDYSYGKSLRFAVDKSLMPGLSFINGRPMPTDGAAAAEMFRSEQGMLFNMVMAGEITDKAPRSVYGKLLSGDLVFKSFHPLLREESDVENKYVEPAHSLGVDSVMIPDRPVETKNPETVFLLEAVVDYSTDEGVAILTKILEVMMQMAASSSPASRDLVLAYRFVPASTAAAASALCPILAQASKISAAILKEVLAAFLKDKSVSPTRMIEAVPSLKTTFATISKSALEECRSLQPLNQTTQENFITLNGRKFTIDNGTVIDRHAVDILVNLELKRAKAVTKLLRKGSSLSVDGISRAAAFLAREETLAESGYIKRRSLPSTDSSATERLKLLWNHKDVSHQEKELQVCK
jgi:Thioredoxin-like domain